VCRVSRHPEIISFENYSYLPISPIRRDKRRSLLINYESDKLKIFPFCSKLDSPKRGNQNSHGGDRKSSAKVFNLIKVPFREFDHIPIIGIRFKQIP